MPSAKTSRASRSISPTSGRPGAKWMEEQMMKVSETQGAYRLVTNLFQKQVGMLKQAIGRER